MIDSIPFTTRARTIDHLGREQIADCPTAISELWKNAYDAYARNVELHIFDSNEPVAGIFDDGHGMNYNDFINKWLVVGTESKYFSNSTREVDQLRLNKRVKQGQKGIGRLSSANMGSILLVISKRISDDFIASLIDWRIFENPFIILSDIKVPVVCFKEKEEFIDIFPQLCENLIGNIRGDSIDLNRTTRLQTAWNNYDDYLSNSFNSSEDSLSEQIINNILSTVFDEKQISHWPVWNGTSKHGTVLLSYIINYDLRAHLKSFPNDALADDTKKRFFQTLSSFIDPLNQDDLTEINHNDLDFNYAVKTWNDDKFELIISKDKEYNRSQTSRMEHLIEGLIDINGVFRGQVKAFSEWRTTHTEYIINPPNDVKLGVKNTSKLGPIDLYIATFEQLRVNSSHNDTDFQYFNLLAPRYSGLMIFRNGLRIMPYGRVDNDFFEIEMRRSKQAGREFWNARRIFGRLAITSEKNPNLKDKAGREGFIDNFAAKTLRGLIINILRTSARDYFGSDSELRKPSLEEVNIINAKKKTDKENIKYLKMNRLHFRTRLLEHLNSLPDFVSKLELSLSEFNLDDEKSIEIANTILQESKNNFSMYKLQGVPSNLKNLEESFIKYKNYTLRCKNLIIDMQSQIDVALKIKILANPKLFLTNQMQRQTGYLHSGITRYAKNIDSLQFNENKRIKDLVTDRRNVFNNEFKALLSKYIGGEISLSIASKSMDLTHEKFDGENNDIFSSYISILQSLADKIDVHVIATYVSEQNEDLISEIDRLNSLAQLGIAVEILGHELQSYDDMISHGLKNLPSDLKFTESVRFIRTGHEGLVNQLRFLSPLKLAGSRTQEYITGLNIYKYVYDFFNEIFKRNNIEFVATPEFNRFCVFEQPARIYPVFINLVNNSIYWLNSSKEIKKTILFSVNNERIIVSDNGPGINEIDEGRLFSLFFTKKLRDGRGVGLYLCRANLSAGSHSIIYLNYNNDPPLKGANFEINFVGAKYEM